MGQIIMNVNKNDCIFFNQTLNANKLRLTDLAFRSSYKKLIRRWDSERKLFTTTSYTYTTKYENYAL